MYKLEKKELQKVEGGAIKFGALLVIGAGVVFIIGLIDGFIRPLKCHG